MKVLIVGDLHLMDTEISSTKKGVENNRVMLDGIYSKVKEDEEIRMVIFLGDIQHRTPKNLKETYIWRTWFRKLKMEMTKRNKTEGGVVVVSNKGQDVTLLKDSPCVFSVRGNHDSEIKNKREDDFTFFDELIEEGLIMNPSGILHKENKVYIEFRNYGMLEEVGIKALIGKTKIITLTHDNIYHDDSSELVKMISEKAGGKHLGEISKGVDLLVNGHIHEKEDKKEVIVDGKKVIYYNLGSMGRTSLIPSMMRDVGYCMEIDISDQDIEERVVEVDVIPYTEYFNMRDYLRNKRIKEDLSDFTLGDVDFDSETLDLESKIMSMEDYYGEDVIDKMLEVLREVDSEIDYGEEE